MTTKTPRGNRLHIGIFGRRNAGKSSLINALTGQNIAIVSDEPGTTADPVYKSMELHPIGPVVFIDTAGFDDEGTLGSLRVAKAESVIPRTDMAIIVVDGAVLESAGVALEGADAACVDAGAALEDADVACVDAGDKAASDTTLEDAWLKRLADAGIPTITVVNKCDLLAGEAGGSANLAAVNSTSPAAGAFADTIYVSAKTSHGIDELRKAIEDAVPEDYMNDSLFGRLGNRELVGEGDVVLLVMPQDIQAPKGRLILPQVQTIRELLDRKCTVISTTADGFERALSNLNKSPDLIITDSQCFKEVYEKKPAESKLTSFSIIMAAAKGDIEVFVEGASSIDDLLAEHVANTGSHKTATGAFADSDETPFRVLIAEACTHVPINEDIGTVKIPRLLQEKFGDRVDITTVRGNDFPSADDLKAFDLIIHCGACMFNRRLVMSRIKAAQEVGVPITNYGVFLAKMAGILDKVTL